MSKEIADQTSAGTQHASIEAACPVNRAGDSRPVVADRSAQTGGTYLGIDTQEGRQRDPTSSNGTRTVVAGSAVSMW